MAYVAGVQSMKVEDRVKSFKRFPSMDKFINEMQSKMELRRDKYPSYKVQTRDELYKKYLEEHREVTTAFVLDQDNELKGELIDLAVMCLLLYKKIDGENNE